MSRWRYLSIHCLYLFRQARLWLAVIFRGLPMTALATTFPPGTALTMLLMYMSAIFYTIDSYSPQAQNLFLLNPVYLFIRCFRKIVIEATAPTIRFHLLMAADVVITLGIGCRMYKKYNTRFPYYV